MRSLPLLPTTESLPSAASITTLVPTIVVVLKFKLLALPSPSNCTLPVVALASIRSIPLLAAKLRRPMSTASLPVAEITRMVSISPKPVPESA